MGLSSTIESALSKASHTGEDFIGNTYMRMQGPPKPLTGKDEVQALDNTAFKVNGQWTAEFVVSVFDRQDEERCHKAENEIMSIIGVKKGELYWDRIKYFVSWPRTNVSVDMRQIDGSQTFAVGPTQYNGIVSHEVTIPVENDGLAQGQSVVFEVLPPNGVDGYDKMTTFFADETGYGVISGYFFLMKSDYRHR
jgi:hypothetical protein